MSTISAALAAALQNDTSISALISGVIPGRNFTLQDALLSTSPYACIAIADLISLETPFLGGYGGKSYGQLEVRCISKSSEQAAKDLAEAVKTFVKANTTLAWNGSTVAFSTKGWRQDPQTSDDLTVWLEILTIDYLG